MKDIYMKKNIIKYTLMKAFCAKPGYFKLKIIDRFKKIKPRQFVQDSSVFIYSDLLFIFSNFY